ncbi:ImpA family type VI secretion system protein [Vibrio ostreicida]|uniref:type VI secretion system protein TssA n=1 Tax=Vibrio ostreicida TaxID=526588 RepID=UPI000970F45C|nr:type VI secretion system ImpA family N-terminal domain-containing protein [Vibrio ostreicida]
MVDIEALLAPISEQQPSGQYLKLDRTAYRTLRNNFNTAQSSFRQLIETPDASSDEELIDANQTNWELLRSSTLEALTSQTKDLEFLGWFIASQSFSQNPYKNLTDSTEVLVRFITLFWDTLNPCPPDEKLSSDDEASQTKERIEFRLKPLLQLIGESQDTTALYMPLQMIGLIGDVSFGDFLRAERAGNMGELKEKAQAEYSKNVDATVMYLAQTYQNFNQAERLIAKHCQDAGVGSVSFKFIKSNLSDLLNAIQYLVGDKFSPWPLDNQYNPVAASTQNDSAVETVSQSAPSPVAVPQDNGENMTQDAASIPNTIAVSASGVITNRDHAFHELRKISEFFQKTEPHSPIPFLIERAIRWGYMSLPELLNEMTGGNSGVLAYINQVSGMDNMDQSDLSSRPAAPTVQTHSVPTSSGPTSPDVSVPPPVALSQTGPVTTSEQTPQNEANTNQSNVGVSSFEW